MKIKKNIIKVLYIKVNKYDIKVIVLIILKFNLIGFNS